MDYPNRPDYSKPFPQIRHKYERAVRYYLHKRHSTLWGRSFDVINNEDAAVEHILEMLHNIEHCKWEMNLDSDFE